LGLPKGVVTVEDIYNLQPHTFDAKGKGWDTYVATVTGKSLKHIVKLASWSKNSFVVSGIEAHLDKLHRVKSMKVSGEPVEEERLYTLATSEGTVQALTHLGRFTKYLPPPYIDTHVLVRDMLLDHAKEVKLFSASQVGEIRVTFPGFDKPVRNRTCGECEDASKRLAEVDGVSSH